ncbi:MAG: type III-A CRISPR-associated RAMP protein Csm3 [Bacteroidales bacterium]|nr:type III-A CRISPR-associated RAMP protein Csm3 [Bacteroidales bacterium]
MSKLIEKVFISGTIVAETGMHIGGSKTALDIGGIDLNVIKTSSGIPYIPGSSIKGKLRSILAREEGSIAIGSEKGIPYNAITDRKCPNIIEIFGDANDKDNKISTSARLIVRDAFLYMEHFKKEKEGGGIFAELELDYTESKWENTINRMTGMANPRQLERVPAGACFKFCFIYNVMDDGKKETHLKEIIRAMRILEDDYLGGQGSRGYGHIKFENVTIEKKTIEQYKGDNQRVPDDAVTF